MSRKKKSEKFLAYALLVALVAGLGGFGIHNFGGTTATVAKVGDREITAQDYFRALTQTIRAQQAAGATDVSLAALDAQGIPAQLRGQLVGQAALDGEAARMGISVGDDVVAERIRAIPAFTDAAGRFDKEAYGYALDRAGYKTPEFERSIREDAARQLLQTSVSAGFAPPRAGLDLIFNWLGERRSYSAVEFDSESRLAGLKDPDEATLAAFFDATKADYMLPEMKRIVYAVLTPQMLAPSVTVSEDALRQAYAQRMDKYAIPERRLVERLVFGTPEEAAAAKAQIDAHATDFDALVTARGLTLEDIDMGAVGRADLGQAGDAVFGLAAPGVIGPYPTDLGPALFRMNGVLPAKEISFKDAAPELRAELAETEASHQIAQMAGDLEDRLAGGATIEELAAETPMETGTVDVWSGATDPVLDDAAFRAAAEAATEDDFPQIAELDGGGVFALRLDEVLPPRQQSLDEVRPAVLEAWRQKTAADLAHQAAETARTALEGGKRMSALAPNVETAQNVTRMALAAQGVPELATAVFDLAPGESRVVTVPDGAMLVRLDAITPADAEDPATAQLRGSIAQQITDSVAADAMIYYVQALTAEAGVTFNDAGLNAVHSQVFH